MNTVRPVNFSQLAFGYHFTDGGGYRAWVIAPDCNMADPTSFQFP
jgi:hypothetical protein